MSLLNVMRKISRNKKKIRHTNVESEKKYNMCLQNQQSSNVLTIYNASGDMGCIAEVSLTTCMFRFGSDGMLERQSSVRGERVIMVASLIEWMCGMRM